MHDAMMITDPKQAGLLMQPVKAAILESLTEPATTAELAQRLSTPRQRLGYHVRQLEGAGLLEVVGETKVRNCVGRQLRSVARRFLVSPEAGWAGGEASGEPVAGRLVSFDSGADRRAFARELSDVIEALASRYGSSSLAAHSYFLHAILCPRPADRSGA